jgi:hypothetical protein
MTEVSLLMTTPSYAGSVFPIDDGSLDSPSRMPSAATLASAAPRGQVGPIASRKNARNDPPPVAGGAAPPPRDRLRDPALNAGRDPRDRQFVDRDRRQVEHAVEATRLGDVRPRLRRALDQRQSGIALGRRPPPRIGPIGPHQMFQPR